MPITRELDARELPTAFDGVIGSFRDPAGSLIRHQGRILRAVRAEFAAEFDAFLASAFARNAMESGQLVHSVRVPTSIAAGAGFAPGALYEHEKIPFPSYPHEWPPEMLAAAGELTLELASSALRETFGLKDATPYNVLFRGAAPVFVDTLSFERRNPFDPSWVAYAQFVRTTLLPLLAHRQFRLPPHQAFLAGRDGLDPEVVYNWASPFGRMSPSFLSLVSLPKWLSGRTNPETYRPKRSSSQEQASFIIAHLLESCRKRLRRLAPMQRDSVWSDYLEHKSLYTPHQLEQKQAFVAEALELATPRNVLDVGANEGRFSFLAAQRGASVVAIDSDPNVVGTIWRRAYEQQMDVLPLIVDLTRPTPALGWRNQECDSFLDRARGHFDLVMMLAVVHHMLVTERIPLGDIFALVSELTSDFALIEFVSPDDPMFRQIVRGREALHADLTTGVFEAAAAPHFEIVKKAQIQGLNRWLYLFRKR